MSKDPRTQVGAIIVGPDHEQRTDGFNGFPRGIADTPERLNDRDKKRVRRLMEQCRVALYRQEGFGVVVREVGPGRALVWRVAG